MTKRSLKVNHTFFRPILKIFPEAFPHIKRAKRIWRAFEGSSAGDKQNQGGNLHFAVESSVCRCACYQADLQGWNACFQISSIYLHYLLFHILSNICERFCCISEKITNMSTSHDSVVGLPWWRYVYWWFFFITGHRKWSYFESVITISLLASPIYLSGTTRIPLVSGFFYTEHPASCLLQPRSCHSAIKHVAPFVFVVLLTAYSVSAKYAQVWHFQMLISLE